MKYFDKISTNQVVKQTLIYGGNSHYKRSGYYIESWKSITIDDKK